MNSADFAQPSGTLVSETWGEQTYLAFVPNPLPPEVGYDRALAYALAEASHKLGELSSLGRWVANPHLLINPFTREEAVLSSRIEGTQTDLLGLYAYEAGQFSQLDPRETALSRNDAREVHNYVQALNYGLEAMKKKPLTLNMLREMHRILLDGVRGGQAAPGEFRRIQNYIGGEASGLLEARYVPPPTRELMPALDAFERYIHASSEEPPLVRLAWLHYQFEAIHPFIDGNGRIGRLIITLLLIEWNLLPAPLLYLSAYIEKHRSAYYDLLLDVSRRSSWREWTLFFLQGIAIQADAAVNAARRLLDLQENWRGQVAQFGNSKTPSQVVDMLFESPIINAKLIVERFNVSQPTASTIINRLKTIGILSDYTPNIRSGWYVAAEVLPKDV